MIARDGDADAADARVLELATGKSANLESVSDRKDRD
jgi:hypothetical protein